MGSVQPVELSESQSRAVAITVREQLARRRMSRQRLADEAKISISTLEKALSGSRPFTLATIVRLEEVLGMSLRPGTTNARTTTREPSTELAPPELGAYSRASAGWLEGRYLTLRPSYEAAHTIFAYRTEFSWSDAEHCLTFREAERLDAPFSQKGVVSMPIKSGHIYLHTNVEGQMRLAILGRPQIDGQLYGLLTTLLAGRGTQLVPVTSPLALIPLPPAKEMAFGRITQKDSAYADYRACLDRVTGQDFARLLGC